jgi:hypothetical protein
MRRRIQATGDINTMRRGLVASLFAGAPITAALFLAASKSAAQTSAPRPGGPSAGALPTSKTVGTPTAAAAKTACSTSDKSCCYYSEIQGDLCCPDLKTGPTRANMTPAQFRALQKKFGNR